MIKVKKPNTQFKVKSIIQNSFKWNPNKLKKWSFKMSWWSSIECSSSGFNLQKVSMTPITFHQYFTKDSNHQVVSKYTVAVPSFLELILHPFFLFCKILFILHFIILNRSPLFQLVFKSFQLKLSTCSTVEVFQATSSSHLISSKFCDDQCLPRGFN